MDFLEPALIEYIEKHTEPEPKVLQELNRDTYANHLIPRMLSGHLQGQVLNMFSKMIQPKYILEVGTYTGYSAICLAQGLQANGKLISIDINEELEETITKYIKKAGLQDKIDLMIGNATEIIPTLDYQFDMVFIDADKENYCNYFNLCIDKVKPGGYILADNVLWSGNVIKEKENWDDETEGIVKFNELVHNDKRVEHVLFPVRDGIMVARKL
ncbi:MAG: O-methyltransferase [Bacteroidia bacterium]|nr:O-methyltransferase [Bacteroidia bacterium]NNC85184.1 O-methyltransferase [Bacteroidia bacterium]NNM15435.1 O-methyltransferase [Bacteroidia bacterium]